jgi:hypothetical protein
LAIGELCYPKNSAIQGWLKLLRDCFPHHRDAIHRAIRNPVGLIRSTFSSALVSMQQWRRFRCRGFADGSCSRVNAHARGLIRGLNGIRGQSSRVGTPTRRRFHVVFFFIAFVVFSARHRCLHIELGLHSWLHRSWRRSRCWPAASKLEADRCSPQSPSVHNGGETERSRYSDTFFLLFVLLAVFTREDAAAEPKVCHAVSLPPQ